MVSSCACGVVCVFLCLLLIWVVVFVCGVDGGEMVKLEGCSYVWM